jgi:hypothetical protein
MRSCSAVRNQLALVRSKGGDINKRRPLLIPSSRDHGPSVRVTRKNDRPRNSLKRALNGRRILGKGGQRQGRREHPDAFGSRRPMTLAKLDPSAQAPRAPVQHSNSRATLVPPCAERSTDQRRR